MKYVWNEKSHLVFVVMVPLTWIAVACSSQLSKADPQTFSRRRQDLQMAEADEAQYCGIAWSAFFVAVLMAIGCALGKSWECTALWLESFPVSWLWQSQVQFTLDKAQRSLACFRQDQWTKRCKWHAVASERTSTVAVVLNPKNIRAESKRLKKTRNHWVTTSPTTAVKER